VQVLVNFKASGAMGGLVDILPWLDTLPEADKIPWKNESS
jgi:hypothetical protein